MAKSTAVLLKKKKIDDAKEAILEKQIDPELKLLLSNDNKTESMLDDLLKGVKM